jgi:Asp-tRNA(Asn)/Glu-tRNA(Gln) amidotransferase A subunit family amidase
MEGSYSIFIILAAQALLLLEDRLSADAGSPRNLSNEGHIMQNLRARIATELPELKTTDLLRYWYQVDLLRRQIAPCFEKYDFFLAPVSASLPVPHGTASYKVGKQKLQSQEVYQFASAVNVLGLPALAFPTELSKEGLPIGLQLIGPRYSELDLIAVLRNAGICDALPPAKLR